MNYYFYQWQAGQGHVLIHRGDCPDCNDGQGKQPDAMGVASTWHGPYRSYEEARAAAEAISPDARNCQRCERAGRIA